MYDTNNNKSYDSGITVVTEVRKRIVYILDNLTIL